MKELEQAIQTAFTDMVTSGQLKKVIETNVQKAVESVLSDCFRNYSPFQKALAEHINATLRVDFERLGLAGYNATLLQIIKTKLDAAVFQFAEKQIGEGLAELLQNPPAEIKVSELVAMLKKQLQEDSSYHEESRPDVVDCEVQTDTGIVAGYGQVKLTVKRRGSTDGRCYELAIDSEQRVYRVSLPYQGDISKRVFAGPFFDFERALFQIYAAKTKLVLDEPDLE